MISLKSLGRLVRTFSQSGDCMAAEAQYGCNNYAPLPVVIARGEGVHLFDVEGRRYYDFISAYSAVNQGHCHPAIFKAFVHQASKLTLTSRAIYNDQLSRILAKLHGLFGYEKALLMNTGVEAGESAIKFARRWGYVSKGVPKDSATVLFAKGNFWGRTIAACGSSDDPERYHNFGPFKGLNFELIDFGSVEALEAALRANPNVVALMVEPIQGERGVIVPPPGRRGHAGYLKAAKEALGRHKALLICDEIQTGLGRTGKMLCSEHEAVRPDMVLLGKALSGGFLPVSAVLCDRFIMDNIKPGEHGSTYGGNPLACAVASAALDVIVEEQLCERAAVLGERLQEAVRRMLQGQHLKEVRGRGLFVGVELESESLVKQFSKALMKHGVLAKPTHGSIMRLAPPLVITDEQLEDALRCIERAWAEVV